MANTKALAFALLAVAVFVPAMSAATVTHDCKGSFLCGLMIESDCDEARDKIQPDKRYFTGGDKDSTGVCQDLCGLFVSGDDCDLSGKEMIQAFDEIRAIDCEKCGTKTFEDGCKFKIDYVLGC